jgi:hypothetical protein
MQEMNISKLQPFYADFIIMSIATAHAGAGYPMDSAEILGIL